MAIYIVLTDDHELGIKDLNIISHDGTAEQIHRKPSQKCKHG